MKSKILHMPSRFINPLVILITVLISIFLTGCDNNDKSSKKSFTVQQPTQKYSKATTLKGKVRNKKGPIHTGEIKAVDNKGKMVASTLLENDDHYSIRIPAGTELPIVLTFYPDAKSTFKKKLNSAVIYTSIKKYDINELTTLIAKKAKALGGYTHINMVMAADSTIDAPDANKTTTGFRGDPTKQYGGWH